VWVAVLAFDVAAAFVVPSSSSRASSIVSTNHVSHQPVPRGASDARPRMSMVEESVSSSDVSIPYDAAARLAYDEWRAKYGKGEFDPVRYEAFKANYETITVANISAKKKARDEGVDPPALMSLNEFGDCTEDEYAAAMQAQSKSSTSTGSVLDKALEAAVSQSEASSALEDAANALAEEEEVRSYGCTPSLANAATPRSLSLTLQPIFSLQLFVVLCRSSPSSLV
jgi:hypothetical protein